MKKSVFKLLVLLYSSTIVSQTDKTVIVYSKSVDQENKTEYVAAIQTILTLKDTVSYEANMRLGWLYYKAGFNPQAIQFYKKAITLKPNAIEPRYGIGFPEYLEKDFNDLIAQDKKILEIDPNNKVINGNLGLIYYYNKEYTKALPHFEKMVTLYPFDYDNNLNLAWTYLNLGKNTEAERYFNVVLLYYPKDKSALDGLTAIKKSVNENEKMLTSFSKSYELSEKSNYKGAIAILKEAYDKESYAVNLRLGWLNYLAGQQVESVTYYKIAIELIPNAIEPKLGITYPSAILGNKNDIRTYYDDILKLDPQNTYVHYKLSILDYEKKEYQNAMTHIEKVASLYPIDTDNLLMLGWTTLQLGKVTEARVIFNKVLCFYPNNTSALLGLKSRPDSEKKKAGF